MAQPLHCDADPCQLATEAGPAPADVLVSMTANGDTTAWCAADWVLFCQAVVAAAESPADEPQPSPPAEPDSDEDEDEDEATIRRLQEYAGPQLVTGPPVEPTAQEQRDEETAQAAVEAPPDTQPPDEATEPSAAATAAPGGTTVVKRGTSASRRRHQAKVKAREQAGESEEAHDAQV